MIHPKRILVITLAMLLATAGIVRAQSSKTAYTVFSAKRAASHINFLASDSLLGRNTPSRGLDTAAAYIAREFKRYGLKPVNGDYYSLVPLFLRDLGKNNSLVISRKDVVKTLSIKSGFIPFDLSASGHVEAGLVFAGYGISAPDAGYDDYAGVDVKGKVVVLLRHQPGEDDTTLQLNGKDEKQYGWLKYKIRKAVEHGAAAMLVVSDPLNHLSLKPIGFPWPSLSKYFTSDALPLNLKTNEKSIPVFHVGPEVAEMMFGSVDSLKKIEAGIDRNHKPCSVEFPDMKVDLTASVDEFPELSNNVVGFLPGTDLKDELVIVGAHYDHVGFNKSHVSGEDYIFNGADDNASGTTGVLMAAEAFGKLKKPCRRSILFITFSGEEKGLFGSQSYVENPLFPLDKTVAMINLDMVSRNSPDSLQLEGGELSPGLTEIVKKANAEVGFHLSTPTDYYFGGSDHASFYNKGIPFVFFTAGLHPDYHTVRDNPNSIDAAKLARVARLAFLSALQVANDDKHYQIIKK